MEMGMSVLPSLYHPACVLNLKRKVALSYIYCNESAFYLLGFNVFYVVIVFELLVYDFTKNVPRASKLETEIFLDHLVQWSSTCGSRSLWSHIGYLHYDS